jgi:hypothetical protein
VTVEGESAMPSLLPSRRYFASGLFSPRVGDFAVFKNPKNTDELFVKKVSKILSDGSYFVESIFSAGSSSADFGDIPKELVLGKILFV